MCARTIATGQGELRQLTFSSNGDLWGVIAKGQIKRFRDANGDGVFQTAEIVNWASTGGNGQNVHIDEAGGYLYSGTTAGVRRWAWSNTIDDRRHRPGRAHRPAGPAATASTPSTCGTTGCT